MNTSDAAKIVDFLTSRNVPTMDPLQPIAVTPAPGTKPPELAAPAGIPTKREELNQLFSRTYDLTVTRAAELSVPVVGSVSGGMNRRVVVLEWTSFKVVREADGTETHWGYSVRLCVTVNKWEANMKVSLPFLAASAEVGEVQASWVLQVIALAGPKLNAALGAAGRAERRAVRPGQAEPAGPGPGRR